MTLGQVNHRTFSWVQLLYKEGLGWVYLSCETQMLYWNLCAGGKMSYFLLPLDFFPAFLEDSPLSTLTVSSDMKGLHFEDLAPGHRRWALSRQPNVGRYRTSFSWRDISRYLFTPRRAWMMDLTKSLSSQGHCWLPSMPSHRSLSRDLRRWLVSKHTYFSRWPSER